MPQLLYGKYIAPAIAFDNRIKAFITSIKKNELKEYTQKYLNYKFNNENIEITKDKIQNSTNNENRKSYYKQQELIYMDYFFYFLVFVYIVILIISCVTMYRKTEMNIAKKVGILGFLFFLPIFSTKILIIILFLMQSFNKNFPKDIHVSKIKLTDLNN